MTKEALKLALEALEEAADAIDSWGSYASGYFQVKHDLENDISKAKSAITAIKEALAQPEQEQFALKHRIAELEGAVIRLQAHRTWVGLTDEEKKDFWTADQMTQKEWDELFADIEAKLKEKNT